MSKKNKEIEEYFNKGTRITDWISYLFLALFLGIYPVITDNKYFNITNTRYEFFMFIAVAFIILISIGYMVEGVIKKHYGYKASDCYDENIKNYAKPEFWMNAFLMANFFSYMLARGRNSEIGKHAFNGTLGRRMGFVMILVIAISFLVICNGIKMNMVLYMIFAVSVLYGHIVAVFQHRGNDFMGYKDGISLKQYDIFIATMGNINIFASFLCICIPVFLSIFIFAKGKVYKITSAVILVLSGMVVLDSNSDSVYLGLFAVFVLLFFLAFKDGKIKNYLLSLVLMSAGVFVQVIDNKFYIKEYDKRGGFSEALDNIKISLGLLIFTLILYVICCMVEKKYAEKIKNINKKNAMIKIGVIFGVTFIAAIVIGIVLKVEYLQFNDKWGSYRGFIWRICGQIYEDAPTVNKLFGYGNDCLKVVTKAGYMDEMISVTGKVYDNAHNEVLQYLITTGLMGAISYIGLFVSSFVYMLKNAKSMPLVYASLAVITGYFVQGFVNLNQAITTPFYFVFMALGIGYIRRIKNMEGNCD